MSYRQVIESECGGVNPLVQLGGLVLRDVTRKDEGLSGGHVEPSIRPDDQMVNEFLGQIAAEPQSFQMQTLLNEMREVEQRQNNEMLILTAPRVIDEVNNQWSTEFNAQHQNANEMIMYKHPQDQQLTKTLDFFDTAQSDNAFAQLPRNSFAISEPYGRLSLPFPRPVFMPNDLATGVSQQFFDEAAAFEDGKQEGYVNYLTERKPIEKVTENLNDTDAKREQVASDYNEKFWQRLHDEWQKLSEESDHPWLTEFSDQYDPYEEYQFAEENPMSELENVFEKGKEYLSKGDIPSAVLCFEVAAKKDPNNAAIWELLGTSQAENEMDPQAISALKNALKLQPDNQRVIMALAVCYTNESLQSHALRMLKNWLQVHPKYKHLVEKEESELTAESNNLASSLIHGNKLQDVQNMYLDAVRLNPQEIDPDIQEALGVLYNLSSEFDKAVDCFRAALQVNPKNAKVWNRLGASLANGSRSVVAVEAYQQALQLEPGFIRVRYNVGVCCMNLKAYKQAAEHLLVALNMQANSAALRYLPTATGAAPVTNGLQHMSESIWSTLKMIISLMGRNDLHDHITNRNLEALNDALK